MKKWQVGFTKKAAKQVRKLPQGVQKVLRTLVFDMELNGPVRGNWKNYSKLSPGTHHCHLKSGKPTYVVCWTMISKEIRILEIYYVGTHEKAPY